MISVNIAWRSKVSSMIVNIPHNSNASNVLQDETNVFENLIIFCRV